MRGKSSNGVRGVKWNKRRGLEQRGSDGLNGVLEKRVKWVKSSRGVK